MKTIKFLGVALVLATGSAFAGPVSYAVGTCGSFFNPAPNAPMTNTWVCPSASSLGVSSVLAEFVNFNSDFSNGLTNSTSTITNWSFSGATFAFSTDTTTSTGGSNSTSGTSSDGLAMNPLTFAPNGWNTGSAVFAGFYNNVTVFGTPTITFTNQSVGGAALQATGYAQVVYAYSTAATTPEPSSLALFGSGLIGLAALGRKKLVRK